MWCICLWQVQFRHVIPVKSWAGFQKFRCKWIVTLLKRTAIRSLVLRLGFFEWFASESSISTPFRCSCYTSGSRVVHMTRFWFLKPLFRSLPLLWSCLALVVKLNCYTHIFVLYCSRMVFVLPSSISLSTFDFSSLLVISVIIY